MSPTPTQRLTAEVLSWPGTSTAIGKREEFGFYDAGRELGHLHGDRVAHFFFPRDVGTALRDAGRVGPHPVNPHSPKLAARALDTSEDVDDVLALLRLNYDRLHGSGADLQAIHAIVDDVESGFNANDVDLATRHFADDAIAADVRGREADGLEAIRAAHEVGFAGPLADQRARYEVAAVRFVGSDVALVRKHATALDGDDEPAGVGHAMVALYVLHRDDGRWRIVARQNTLTEAAGATA